MTRAFSVTGLQRAGAWLPEVGMVFMAAVASWLIFFRPPAVSEPATPVPGSPIPIRDLSTTGASTARAALIEFADFQCPYCGVFARDSLRPISDDYLRAGSLIVAFAEMPLNSIHRNARTAAQAAECAANQGAFWPMHDWLFQHQRDLDVHGVTAGAAGMNLDAKLFDRCLNGPTSPRLDAGLTLAQQLGVRSTPTFFLGTLDHDGSVIVRRVLVGAQSVESFRKVIDNVVRSASH